MLDNGIEPVELILTDVSLGTSYDDTMIKIKLVFKTKEEQTLFKLTWMER
jgi:hypothetical protein